MIEYDDNFRTATPEFFEQSGIRDNKKLLHTPPLVLKPIYGGMTLKIVSRPADLLDLPDETEVIMQWEGQWRSDFFKFTVGDFRKHITAAPATRGHLL